MREISVGCARRSTPSSATAKLKAETTKEEKDARTYPHTPVDFGDKLAFERDAAFHVLPLIPLPGDREGRRSVPCREIPRLPAI
jgi:hypothetical protein